jgi:hypothetical protein
VAETIAEARYYDSRYTNEWMSVFVGASSATEGSLKIDTFVGVAIADETASYNARIACERTGMHCLKLITEKTKLVCSRAANMTVYSRLYLVLPGMPDYVNESCRRTFENIKCNSDFQICN